VDKRLQKRHKRQVARAKQRVKVSEPDVRTPEQVKAAQEAGRPADRLNSVRVPYATPPRQDYAGPVAGRAAKVDD
jgi:hypothetical protein